MAKRRIETEIDINAPAAKVWAVLTDFPKMPLWNPFITAIAGTPAAGERLTITVRPPGKSAVTGWLSSIAANPSTCSLSDAWHVWQSAWLGMLWSVPLMPIPLGGFG